MSYASVGVLPTPFGTGLGARPSGSGSRRYWSWGEGERGAGPAGARGAALGNALTVTLTGGAGPT